MNNIKKDAITIINTAIKDVLPDEAVKKALENKSFPGKIIVVSIGKAAWTMANAAHEILKDKVKSGVVITKYNHSKGSIGNFEIIEAGHPLLDENSIAGTSKALEAVSGLEKEDTVIFLISGGGSALFEKPLEGVTLDDILDVTNQLLKCGADIVEINTIRKHLSAVKGGRFAKACLPASVYSIVLSDVLGDRLDSIASGPAYPDTSTSSDAFALIEKYSLNISPRLKEILKLETPKKLSNVETIITGSVKALCTSAAKTAETLGYKPLILTSTLDCEAKEAGKMLASIARSVVEDSLPIKAPCAIILGGETVVRITGKGKGGRNQEIALQAANLISNMQNVIIASVGSDGTDGPTDAAGGVVSCQTKKALAEKGINIDKVLFENNSYNALKEADSLLITGPTGTNVNDLQFILIK